MDWHRCSLGRALGEKTAWVIATSLVGTTSMEMAMLSYLSGRSRPWIRSIVPSFWRLTTSKVISVSSRRLQSSCVGTAQVVKVSTLLGRFYRHLLSHWRSLTCSFSSTGCNTSHQSSQWKDSTNLTNETIWYSHYHSQIKSETTHERYLIDKRASFAEVLRDFVKTQKTSNTNASSSRR